MVLSKVLLPVCLAPTKMRFHSHSFKNLLSKIHDIIKYLF